MKGVTNITPISTHRGGSQEAAWEENKLKKTALRIVGDSKKDV